MTFSMITANNTEGLSFTSFWIHTNLHRLHIRFELPKLYLLVLINTTFEYS